MTFQNADSTAAGGVFNANAAARSIIIAPSGTLGTGRVIFKKNHSTGEGGVFYNAGPVSVMNADFIENAASNGGVLRNTSASGPIEFNQVLFEGNRAANGGVFASYGNITVTSGTFTGNYTSAYNGVGGVLANYSSSLTRPALFTGASFINNRAANGGVAGRYTTNGILLIVDAPEISGNWAVQNGGVINDANNRNNGYYMLIRLSGSTGMDDYVYSGNAALGLAPNATNTGTAALISGSYSTLGTGTAVAGAGGFYYATVNSLLRFDIAGGVSLAIGKAGNPAALDSIATIDNAVAGITALIEKNGGGRLVLHADNAHYKGAITVNEGSLFLGNANARLGGAITIADGATFGGSGTLTTLLQNSTVVAGRTLVTATAGATLRAGLDTADEAGTLAVSGSVILKDGAILAHDLFSSGSASLLKADALTQEADAIINLGLLENGTFTLAEWTTGGLNAGRLALTVNGGAETARSSGMLFIDGGTALKVASTVSSLELKWTGSEGGEWAGRTGGRDWTDGQANAEKHFRDGDRVVFDGEADADNPEARAVTVGAAGVTVADMRVAGDADYLFRGAGGITADAGAADGALITGSGMLVKRGAGELIFTNTGANLFINGIDVAGGVVAFDRAGQLATGGGAGIVFSDSGTLRAAAGASGTLSANINIAAGKTAGVETGAPDGLVYSGTVSSGAADSVLRKTGGGVLLLLGDSGANAGAVRVEEGALLAGEGAGLGGRVSVAAGATLGGAGEFGAGGDVTADAGAVLMAGVDSSRSGTLTLTNINIAGGVVLQFDLYNDMDGAVKRSDRILGAGTAQISGTSIIDITTLASGTFNLGNLAGLADNYQVTLNDMVLPASGRLSAALDRAGSGAGEWLRLVTTADKSREITWTGSGGASWSVTAENWAGSGGVTQYGYGDHAVFDGTADNRVISIDGAQVNISGMTVAGGADHVFTGGGGIRVGTDSVMDDGSTAEIENPSGKLIKSGDGVLIFANDAANDFEHGIALSGGAIVFSRADQLGAPGTAITFTDDAALRAGAAALELANTLVIEDGVTGAVDSNGHDLALAGALSGGADATLAKDGAGAVLLAADTGGFTGTLAVREGVLRAAAAHQFTAAGAPAIRVDAGATLDLDGHDQTLTSLAGAGVVDLGAAALVYNVASGMTHEFAGAFTGAGQVVKGGAGAWILSGSSGHEGGFIYNEGSLGLASGGALGAGALVINAAGARISIEAGGIDTPNDITVGAGGVTIETNGLAAEFSGKIGGAAVTLEGAGTLAFSGNNTFSSLDINNARLIARRAESITGAVTIAAGSVLEFRGVAAGQVHGGITGGRLLFTSSTLSLLGTNRLDNVIAGAGADITVASTGALGGPSANIVARDGGTLRAAVDNITGRDMTIDGGVLVFGADYQMGSLALTGTLAFVNGGEVRLAATLPTGVYTAAVAGGGIPAMPAYDPHQGGMFMVLDIIDGESLRVTAYNKALEPGKEIAVGFDAMTASARSIHAHIAGEFLAPADRGAAPAPGSGLWFSAIGSFAEYGDDYKHLGYTESTWAGIIGCDWLSGGNALLGGYLGYSSTRLETGARPDAGGSADTDMALPRAGLYGAAKSGIVYMTANLGAGFGSADTARVEDHGNAVTGTHDLDIFGGGIEAGLMLRPFADGLLRPSVGFHYMNLRFHDYREKGRGAVRIDSFRAHSMQAVFRCDAAKALKLPWGRPGVVELGLGWRQSLRTRVSEVRAALVGYPDDAAFLIRGDDYADAGVTGGVGVRLALSRRLLFSLAYDFDYSPAGTHDSDTIRHTFNSVLRLGW
ncbi:MAG: hypothetical protein LBI02_07400 [Opitutaceae bacterium]|nr:hypothetical protein [Opitutaceae bacterium]